MVNCTLLVKALAWNWHTSLPLTLHWPKQVTWPCLTSDWGNACLPLPRRRRNGIVENSLYDHKTTPLSTFMIDHAFRCGILSKSQSRWVTFHGFRELGKVDGESIQHLQKDTVKGIWGGAKCGLETPISAKRETWGPYWKRMIHLTIENLSFLGRKKPWQTK